MGRLNHQQIINDYLGGKSQNKLAVEWQTTQPVISKLLRRHKINKPRQVKYKIINIFLKKSEISTYILGFLLADGHIAKKEIGKRGNRYKIQINLQGADYGHLRKIADCFCRDLPIKITKRLRRFNKKKSKVYVNARLSIYSSEIVSKLLMMGWDEFKKEDDPYIMREIPKNYIRHVLRGYFDGDGGFYIGKFPVAYLMGDKNTLKWIKAVLNNSLNIGGFVKKRKNRKIWCLIYNGVYQTALLANFLYRKATIQLDRKALLAKTIIELARIRHSCKYSFMKAPIKEKNHAGDSPISTV